MGCSITSTLAKSCTRFLSGIDSIYLANYNQVSAVTTTSGGTVTGITMTSGSTSVFYELSFEDKKASVSQTFTNQRYISQSLNLTLFSDSQDASNYLTNILGAKLMAVVKLKTGTVQLFGKLNGLKASESTFNSGAAPEDDAGITITLAGEELDFAPTVSPSLLNTAIFTKA